MRLVVISDTHGQHDQLGELEGDVLIHCGDVEHLFAPDPHALEKVDAWFARQRFRHILVIGGNHDLTLERRLQTTSEPFRNATYLQDGAVDIDGIRFYGTPWVPMLSEHAFFADDAALSAAWAKVPEDVDVLMTHTPPRGVLDVSSRGLVLGCPLLLKKVTQVSPRIHCFGHVHAASGIEIWGETTFLNASSVNSDFQIAVEPYRFDLTADGLFQV